MIVCACSSSAIHSSPVRLVRGQPYCDGFCSGLAAATLPTFAQTLPPNPHPTAECSDYDLIMATQTSEKWIRTREGLFLWSESFGAAGDKSVLLIMGAMNPGLFWPDEFCQALAGRGLSVIRYDHRDTGRSSKVDFARHPYTLDELTNDTLEVLDGYGFERANVIGLSMGGYIAQLLAARHAQRVDKLVLLSTTADHRPYMAATTGEATARQDAFLSPPAASFIASVAEAASRIPASREEADQIALAVWRSIYAHDENAGEPGHAFPADFILDCMRRARSCGHDQGAAFNHAAAVLASPSRLSLLDAIPAPTLVIHGCYDPCLPLDHGEYLASHIRDARLQVLAMGHVFPPEMSGQIASLIAAFID